MLGHPKTYFFAILRPKPVVNDLPGPPKVGKTIPKRRMHLTISVRVPILGIVVLVLGRYLVVGYLDPEGIAQTL